MPNDVYGAYYVLCVLEHEKTAVGHVLTQNYTVRDRDLCTATITLFECEEKIILFHKTIVELRGVPISKFNSTLYTGNSYRGMARKTNINVFLFHGQEASGDTKITCEPLFYGGFCI